MAARKVLLLFDTLNLDKAKKAAKEVATAAKEAAKSITDVKKRREALRQAREDAREQRQIINEERKRQRGDIRSRRQRRRSRDGLGQGPDLNATGDLKELLTQFAEGRGGQAAFDVAFRALTAVPALGVIGQLAWEKFGRPLMERQLKALERERIQPLLVRLEAIERSTIERQLAESLEFGRSVRGEAARQDQARDGLSGKRWTPSSKLDRL